MKFLKIGVAIIISLIIVEIGGHFLYRWQDEKWLWQHKTAEIFPIRTFTQFVPGDRMITNRKAIFSKEYRFGFDNNRFRIGLNNYDKKSPSIVFLGDSVPFGWGVDWDKSLPSIFYAQLQQTPYKKYGVINAAVPSYSLHQSIARYAEEIHGIFPVRLVIAQIYDPANQLAAFGRQWTQQTNSITNVRTEKLYRLQQTGVFRYSSIFHTIGKVALAISNEKQLDIYDTQTHNYFQSEVEKDLYTLLNLVQQDGASLILLPVNPSTSYKKQLKDGSNDPLIHAIDWLNRIFHDFAQDHPSVLFLDVVDFFDRIGREGKFVDACCHLSAEGAREQSNFLYQELKKNKFQ